MSRLLLIAGILATSFGTVKSTPEESIEAINRSIERGVDFLLTHQNDDGSWGDATRTKGLNIYAPVPDAHQAFKAASSSLALHGLLESGDRRPATLASIARGEQWLLENLPGLRNINPRAT